MASSSSMSWHSDRDSPLEDDYATDYKQSSSMQEALPGMKKARRIHSRTSFNAGWTKKHPCIVKVNGDAGKAFCTACRKSFTVCHQGYRDVVRHIESYSHQSASGVIAQSCKITDTFLSEKNEISTRVISAEVKFTGVLLEHNLPIATADHAGPLFRFLFPDSKVESFYGSARTKTTSIINGALAPAFSSSIITMVQNQPFTLSLDW